MQFMHLKNNVSFTVIVANQFYFNSASVKKSLLVAFAIATTSAVVLCIYAAGWRLAAFLVTEERIGILEVFR